MDKARIYRLINLAGALVIFVPAYIAGKYVLVASIGAVTWSLFWGTMAKRELQKERASRLKLVVKGTKGQK